MTLTILICIAGCDNVQTFQPAGNQSILQATKGVNLLLNVSPPYWEKVKPIALDSEV